MLYVQRVQMLTCQYTKKNVALCATSAMGAILFCTSCCKSSCIRSQFSFCNGFYNFSCKYHKIPIISPGLIFVQKAFLLGLFLGELIFGGAYYWKEF